MIRDMVSIEVAADTVRRFYRQVIEESLTGIKRFSKRERSAACVAELANPSRCHVADRRRRRTTCGPLNHREAAVHASLNPREL